MPSIGTECSMKRMPSTAAWSAASLSPRPTSGAAARAAASVTRTSSSARFRSGSCGVSSAFTAPETYNSAAPTTIVVVSDGDLTLRAQLPPDDGPSIGEMARAAAEQHVADRLVARDATLWGPEGTPEVANRLGWLTIAERVLDELLEIERVADGARHDGLTDVVLLGMGGSSLAPEVLRRTFAGTVSAMCLHVLDSTDAATIAGVQASVDPARTLFIVSSKSGGT